MNARKLLIAALAGTSGMLGAHLVHPTFARAQDATSGAVQGVVADEKTGDALPGVTVIVTSPALAQTQTAITDENGHWQLSGLPSASYDLTFYYGDATGELGGVAVSELDTRTADYSFDIRPPPLVVTFSGEE